MLELRKVKKDYPMGDGVVHALRGIDLKFRRSEFVSILGPSGCGKTTLLNIIGGLDQYSDGDLLINGVSTKEYTARDWDTYRNHSIGFVFQSYNLIPHQTVLQNVELALALSGVSKSERRERAKKALASVGLDTQLNKKPSEMSGGQMQRVAIARALVNNPDIILADEPTGALDSETSIQVMEILKEISKERLVVMVTHNPEIADAYSTRIVRMLDGEIISDSNPVTCDESANESIKLINSGKKRKRDRKPSMSLKTSFTLSLKNLFSKKTRTMLTSFAGSIGIIGIALIFAVSQGTTGYINYVQETTLASYPITLEETTVDMSAVIQSILNMGEEEKRENRDEVYKDPLIGELVNALAKMETNENDLSAFKLFLEEELKKEGSDLQKSVTGVQYAYDLELPIYTKNVEGKIVKSDTEELMNNMITKYFSKLTSSSGNPSTSTSTPDMSMYSNMMQGGLGLWRELLPGMENGQLVNELILNEYELIDGGRWPNDYNEVVLIVDQNNQLDDLTLYALGLLTDAEIDDIINKAVAGEEIDKSERSWSYEDIKNNEYKIVLPSDRYQKATDTLYVDMSASQDVFNAIYEDKAIDLKIVGIVRQKDGSDATILKTGIGYTNALTKKVIEKAKDADVYKAQSSHPDVNVLTGRPFKSNIDTMTDEQKQVEFISYVSKLSEQKKAQTYVEIACVEAEKLYLKDKTDEAMAQFTDKNVLINMISSGLASQYGVPPEQIALLFADKTLDELKAMIKPSIEEQVRQGIRTETTLNLMPKNSDKDSSPAEKAQEIANLSSLMDGSLASYTTEQCALYYDEVTEFSDMNYDEVLVAIGCVDEGEPSEIRLYTSAFENKDVILKVIEEYNNSVDKSRQIKYTDYMGMLMSGITTIIDAISYVLIAFVSVSLVVSSIMIGVITLISVQERTKEIGILRALGASKRNVSTMFNAETMIIGLSSGLLGVGVTYLLCIPINIILHSLTGISHLSAVLPIGVAGILVAISVLLTLVSGLIPSRSASKKDPVVALRTE